MKKIALVAAVLVGVGFLLMLAGFMIGITPLFVDASGLHIRTLQQEVDEFITTYDKEADIILAFASEDVTIVSEEGTRFGYSIEGNYYHAIECSLQTDRLVMKEKNPGLINFGWGTPTLLNGPVLFGRGATYGPRVTVYVPRDMTVKTLDLSLVSGDLKIESINARTVKIDGVSGNVTARDLLIEGALTANLMSGDILLDSIEAQTMRVDGASGNFTARNIMTKQSLVSNLISGDVRVSGKLLGEVVFRATSGNLTLEIDGRADDYQWRIDALTADTTVRDASGGLASSSSGGPNRISIDAISGDVSIEFLK